MVRVYMNIATWEKLIMDTVLFETIVITVVFLGFISLLATITLFKRGSDSGSGQRKRRHSSRSGGLSGGGSGRGSIYRS